MFGQTLELHDVSGILVLIALEGLLSGDNALVLALLVRHLPPEQQGKALRYGLIGAFFFRLVAILCAAYVLKLWWLQLIGAGYLIFLTIKHFIASGGEGTHKDATGKSFWRTVITVEIMDIAFAIDSVLAGVAFVSGRSDKVWVVFAGAMVGVILLRFVAQWFVQLMQKYPMLDAIAYAIVGWVGVKLLFLSAHTYEKNSGQPPFGLHIPEMSQTVFWIGMGLIILVGFILARVGQAKQQPEYPSPKDE